MSQPDKMFKVFLVRNWIWKILENSKKWLLISRRTRFGSRSLLEQAEIQVKYSGYI